jgi:uncharacterized protein (TIGR00661 family)
MKILYGIQGTGNGHITRARMFADTFAERGIEVDYFFSGRPAERYFDMDCFGSYRTREGFSFVTEQGRINPLKSAQQLSPVQFLQDIKQLDLAKYDVVLNDFEPISAWAAKNQRIPVIGMSHQASFLHDVVPVSSPSYWRRQFIRYFAPANVYLGVHWQPFHRHIIPPFVSHSAFSSLCPSVANKVLVYLPFEPLSSVVDYLNDFPGTEFYCYHPDASNQSIKHIHLRSPSRLGFLHDLANSSGVVANAGFELSTEALHLGKKLLLKPLHGQFEQLANVLALEQLGLAHSMQYLNPNVLDDWMRLSSNAGISFPTDSSIFIDWLLAGIWDEQSISALHDSLWQQVLPKLSSAA